MEIAKIVNEKQKEKEDLMEIMTAKEIVHTRFYMYLKVFEKKESERVPIRMPWNYTIDFREGFV